MSSDPLRLLWDALEAHGYRPHGQEHQFRAGCPAHDGDNPTSLSVGIGADGRAVVHCHAHGCEAKDITAALGLRMADLFPDGHHRGRRHPLRPLRRSDFAGVAATVANVLHAHEEVGEQWELMLTSRCPYCGHPGAWLRARSAGHRLENGYLASEGRVDADCPNGCDADNYVQGLLGHLAEKEKTDA